MPSREVDGYDFFAVYEAGGEMIERARSGGGPSLMHVKLQRFYGHFEGDAQTYRAPGEAERARAQFDPLNIFRQRVVETSLLDPAEFEEVDRTAREEIERAVAAAKAAPMPTEADLLTDVYVRY